MIGRGARMEHVLIVDTDMETLKTTELALQRNYKVSLATSIDQAIICIGKDNPKLLLLSGTILDSIAHLEGINKFLGIDNLPILAIVDQEDWNGQARAIKLGAADLITKPIVPDALCNRVKNYLELYYYREDETNAERFQDAISVSFAELVEFRDETTGGHLKNTSVYFRILLEEVMRQEKYKDTINPQDVKDILRSIPLHDIGKIGINDDILRKSSMLNNKEYESMKKHTILGKQAFEKIIAQTGETRWLNLAKDMAYYHHERWDGTGYPEGLKGEEIPLYVRVLTIADVYDALTSWRSYKEPYSHDEAMKIIEEGKGTLFDPSLVELLITINEQFKQALLQKK
ncbi:MAG: HD domain-containing protein [Clostridiales bacterium]|nr:HD domain-containing protein [Clostridiales bacterium]